MKHDGYSAGKYMLEQSNVLNAKDASNQTKNTDKFCKEMQKIVEYAKTRRTFENLGVYVFRICDAAQESMVRLNPSYFQILMSLKVMEGICLSLDEDIELISKCVPMVMQFRAAQFLGLNKSIDEDNHNASEIKDNHDVNDFVRAS